MQKKSLLWLLAGFLLLAACGEDPTPTPAPTATTAATPTLAPTATATPQPSPTPSPTPLRPGITLSGQTLDEDGILTVDDITIPDQGWLVIYADEDGMRGEMLAHVPVPAGVSEDVSVTVDPLQATPTLYAVLHTDAGVRGEFEFPPGPDTPLGGEADATVVAFAVDVTALLPAVSISDQDLSTAGQVDVASVTSLGPGWVAIHADANGEVGPILGQTPVQDGVNKDLVVTFDWHQATSTLYAVLYEDAGAPGRFEFPETDQPFIVNNNRIISPFTVTLPPDVFVINQPAADGEIVVERAVSNGPGWLVVYSDLDGVVDLIIGEAALEPGVNENVVVPIVEEAMTDLLHIMIHEDTETVGEFDYPRADPPVRYDGQLQVFSFRTDAGNYLITEDQPLSEENTVVIPLAVTDVSAWVVIRAEEAGEPGEIIGMTLVPAGVNRDVTVTIDPTAATSTLYTVLHLDGGTAEEFEYPDGPDVPLQRNRNIIQAPFTLLQE